MSILNTNNVYVYDNITTSSLISINLSNWQFVTCVMASTICLFFLCIILFNCDTVVSYLKCKKRNKIFPNENVVSREIIVPNETIPNETIPNETIQDEIALV